MIDKNNNIPRGFSNETELNAYIERNNLKAINKVKISTNKIDGKPIYHPDKKLIYTNENKHEYILFYLFANSDVFTVAFDKRIEKEKNHHMLLKQNNGYIFDLIDDDAWYARDDFLSQMPTQDYNRFDKKRQELGLVNGENFTNPEDIKKAKNIILELIKEDIDAIHAQGISFSQIYNPWIYFDKHLVIRDMIDGFIKEKINHPEKDHKLKESVIQYILEKEKSITNGLTINTESVGACHCYYHPQTMLMEYIGEGMSDRPKKLLEIFPDVNPFMFDKDNKNALLFVIAKGRKETTGSEGYDDFHSDQRPLFKAILKNKDIANGINVKGHKGNTALHLACARGEIYYIEKLLKAGADINLKNDAGQTPNDILKLTKEDRTDIMCTIYISEGSVDEIKENVEMNSLNHTAKNINSSKSNSLRRQNSCFF